MTYTLKVGEELMGALNKAGREEVRRILCLGLGVAYEEAKRGRPRKGTPLEKETPKKKKEPVIKKGDPVVKEVPLKETEPLLVKETPLDKGNPVPTWQEKLVADRERIARQQTERRERQKAKQVNHDPPPVEEDELPPAEL